MNKEILHILDRTNFKKTHELFDTIWAVLQLQNNQGYEKLETKDKKIIQYKTTAFYSNYYLELDKEKYIPGEHYNLIRFYKDKLFPNQTPCKK